MRTRRFAFFLALSCLLANPVNASRDSLCEDESRQASPWIQWGLGYRAACSIQATDPQILQGCLEKARSELSKIAREHALVYANQIVTLEPGHPIVSGLLAKLGDNVKAAELAIFTNTEPELIQFSRRQACLNRR